MKPGRARHGRTQQACSARVRWAVPSLERHLGTPHAPHTDGARQRQAHTKARSVDARGQRQRARVGRWALLQLSEDGRERDHDRRRPPNTCRLSRRDRQRKNRIMRAATTRVASTRAAACPRRAAAAVAAAALWPSGGLMARGAPRGLRASRTNGAHTLHAKMAAWHRSTGVQLRVCVRVCAWVCSRLDECSATPPA